MVSREGCTEPISSIVPFVEPELIRRYISIHNGLRFRDRRQSQSGGERTFWRLESGRGRRLLYLRVRCESAANSLRTILQPYSRTLGRRGHRNGGGAAGGLSRKRRTPA